MDLVPLACEDAQSYALALLNLNKRYIVKFYARIKKEGGRGSGQNHKFSIEFLSNTSRYPLKIHKATKSAFNVGPSSARQRNAI